MVPMLKTHINSSGEERYTPRLMCPPGKIKSKMKINKDENKSKEKKVKVLYDGIGRHYQQPFYLLLSKFTEHSDL